MTSSLGVSSSQCPHTENCCLCYQSPCRLVSAGQWARWVWSLCLGMRAGYYWQRNRPSYEFFVQRLQSFRSRWGPTRTFYFDQSDRFQDKDMGIICIYHTFW